VSDMLVAARRAVGSTYQGWKGGEFTMTLETRVWIAIEGSSGEMLGPTLLDYMTGEVGDA